MRKATTAFGALCLLVVLSAPWGSVSTAGEIGFLEELALAKDREEALKQLIPGTRDYYYYHALHNQNVGKLDEVDRLLKLWIKRYNRTDRVQEIENRQALLRYATDPQGSLEFLRQRLDLKFNHEREVLGAKRKLPTSLNPALISRENLTRRALQKHEKTLGGFEDRALDWAANLELSPERRRHLLSRLRRPDIPELPRLVVEDLKYQHSRGFGSHQIHRLLLLPQLEECLRLKPDLLNQQQFVNVYLTKLWPNPDVNWRHTAKDRERYLDRLWGFASRLSPAHNSLKAHVLFHRLVHDRGQGVYDKSRFMTYIRLPRNVPYISREYMKDSERRRHPADLNARYRNITLLPPVRSDEPLVRSYLEHFFLSDTTYKPYAPYIEDIYLKHRFAETKILAGLGDMEEWYSMLPPEQYKALRERVDIDFAHSNKTLFDVGEQVSLDVHVKNVRTLLVKVFEINAVNYYRAQQREVDTAVDLDGLVASVEKTHSYAEPSLRRVKRHFEFPELGERGTFVVEFIGNGKSSRALVRKGKLRFLVRNSTAGHIFTVLDEANRKLPRASLWLGGHDYTAGDDGTIAVPFSNSPGRRPIILLHEGFASLDFFEHQSERYKLAAGIHVEREALVKRKKAEVLVRPSLTLNGTPVTLSVLENVTLAITSTDLDGVSTTTEIKDFKLFEDRESLHEFQVPAKLSRLHFALKAKVENLSQQKKQDLLVTNSFTLNGIDATEKIEDLHLSRPDRHYVIDLLGKTGEVKPGRPVEVTLKHRDFVDTVVVSLQTEAGGRIDLGSLDEIDWVSAKGPEGTQHRWHLAKDRYSLPQTIHGRVGETISVPYMGSAVRPVRSEFSLLETRGNSFVRDRFDALSISTGYLELRGLPAGDYDLQLKGLPTRIKVRLTAGEHREGYVLSDYRQLEVRNRRPLQIAKVESGENAVLVRLENSSPFSRVHAVATRYVPEYSVYDDVGVIPHPEPYAVTVPRPETDYVVGRDIGDEYRYILERKQAKPFPGNMLKRPSLLLNPWAIRSTEAGRQLARAGEAYDSKAPESASARAAGRRPGEPAAPTAGAGFANLDFLARPAVVLTNLQPDKEGVVRIPRGRLRDAQQLHVIALDPQATAYRQISLPESDPEFADLRLAAGLDSQQHYTEQKQISVVKKDARFLLDDITTSDFEVYDSLDKVYALFRTLSGNATLVEFGFLLVWPSLKEEEKRERYSRYACHELNFFLFRKDPEFFRGVVRPHLKSKYHKTFLDHWLLGDDLRGYLKPWAYSQLNVVERILLASKIEGERAHTARHVKDSFDLLPPDVERLQHHFHTALKGRALEAGDDFGVEEAKKALRPQEKTEDKALRRVRTRRSVANRGFAIAGSAEGDPAAPPRPAKVKAARKLAGLELSEPGEDAVAEVAAGVEARDAELFFGRDRAKQRGLRQLYSKLDQTKEWVENNYYHLPIESQNAGLVTVNAFWRDYARHDGKGPFFSPHFSEASRNFAEMMFALSVLDLPFEAAEHKTSITEARFTLDAASPLVVFHKEIKRAPESDEKVPILVSQNFYRHGDRYFHVNGERLDKYVSDEFLVHTVYGCHVVITNPTSSRQKLDVLLQIPRGALPVLKGHYTRSANIALEPYRTWTHDYFFYFPAAGNCEHYPVHVAKNEQLIGFAPPAVLKVVEQLSRVDRNSWDYVSQHGTQDQVLGFLEEHNLGRVQLERIAWRMRDEAFFKKVLALLARRHAYNHTLWSYGIQHNVPGAIREYLRYADAFVQRLGPSIDCELVTIDPVERKSYQHMEYWPLVNARAHRLGKTRQILNDRFFSQYMRFLKVLTYRRNFDDDDLMSITYYLLLQDRIESALGFFERIRPQRLASKLQYDYFTTYLGCYTENLRRVRSVAASYGDYPVAPWRELFTHATAQLDEIEGKAPQIVDEEDRGQRQTQLAATEASFEFDIESEKITLRYQNLKKCRVNYYLMDIELLFSRNPFVQEYSDQFAFIRPNLSVTLELDPEKKLHQFELPEKLESSNVLVEIAGGGVRKSKTRFANALSAQLVENYAQVKVTDQGSSRALPKVYVKVFARMKNGRVRFYKDGYTDLRGRFDYGSLSTNDIEGVQKFSILVLSDTHGALVREASPPQL